MVKSEKSLPVFVCFVLMCAFISGAIMDLDAKEIHLPRSIGDWTRPDEPNIVNSENIFDYMNGAGELYLSYRFRHLEVFDYSSKDQGSILVELYFMETSDDAYGLLSLDWGGEPVSFSDSPESTSNESLASSTRALYGAGLLRLWSDDLYARVMAYRETPESKQAVLALGEAITANRKNPPEPELVKSLTFSIGSTWKLRKDRLHFFRSYLVLNSIYYLSQENILNLDLPTAAIAVPYENISSAGDRKRSQFLLVKYKNSERAQRALNHFHEVYLSEFKREAAADSGTKNPSLFKLEDGWLAYKLFGKHIAIVFECPDRESARIIIEKTNPVD